MSFGAPWLLLLLLLPAAVLVRRWRGKREATIVVGDAGPLRKLPATWRQRLHRVPLILRVAAVSLLVLAAARPMSTRVTERIKSEGIDIIVTLDVSGSMRARDFRPNDRMFVAKQTTERFIAGRIADRLGLVLFAGNAITQCPLTVDHAILVQQVEQTQAGMLGDGTAIGMALATAENRLRQAPGKSRVIVLLTDGNNNTGEIDPVTAAKLAGSLGMKIYTIGVGKRGPAEVPVRGPFGEQLVQLPDELDEPLLKQIAQLGHGKYFRATDKKGLERIFDEIDRMEKTEVEREKATHYADKFEPLLWLGMALLALELLLAGGPLRKVE
jgi:Ca-activated chloride channel family protein